MDDWRLLRQYLDNGSEAAFTRLVDRHIKMVYGTCRRDIQSDQSAEDATQAVFLLLAQKAFSLQPNIQIAGWLFHTARLVCKNANRSEARRRHYEQEAVLRMEPSSAQQAGWQQVEPWINDGLSSLRPPDRDILLLRYFEGRSLSEVAAAIGASESATKTRISRALDRLRQYFLKKDLAVSSLVLPALLSEHSLAAVSDSCRSGVLHALRVGSLTSPSLSLQSSPPLLGDGGLGRGGFLAKGLLIVSTTKIVAGGVAAVVLILALTFVVVHRAHSTATSGSLSQFAVTWQAPSASDSATQQAQQQIEAQLNQLSSGTSSGNAQQCLAVLSPDFTLVGGVNNGKPHNFTYSDEATMLPTMLSARYKDAWFTVTSCSIAGNSATLDATGDWSFSSRPLTGPGVHVALTFVNTGGKWLMSRSQVVR